MDMPESPASFIPTVLVEHAASIAALAKPTISGVRRTIRRSPRSVHAIDESIVSGEEDPKLADGRGTADADRAPRRIAGHEAPPCRMRGRVDGHQSLADRADVDGA